MVTVPDSQNNAFTLEIFRDAETTDFRGEIYIRARAG